MNNLLTFNIESVYLGISINYSKTIDMFTHIAKTDFSRFKNPLDEMYEN